MKERIFQLKVDAEAAGERLDLFLAARVVGASRKKVKRALDRGQVRIEGEIERIASRELRCGETIVAQLEVEPLPPPAQLSILYRDTHLLAVDKPAGLPPHRGSRPGPHALELATALVGAEARPPVLLHRLDMDTSGVLLFALSDLGNRELSRQFAEREIEKTYLALVQGNPPAQFRVENYLKPKSRGRTIAVRSGGQKALTEFTTLRRGDGFALVEARPKTGRTHQIRAHLSEAGFPLLGDPLYAGPAIVETDGLPLSAPRHLLHASRLVFRHPAGSGEITVTAPLPEDFSPFLELLP